MERIIFLTGKRAAITVDLPENCYKTAYAVRVAPVSHPFEKGTSEAPFPPARYFTVNKNAEGRLIFDYDFPYECEYVIYVDDTDEPAVQFDYYSPHQPLVKKSVYALREDLYGLIPLKIDFHAHSNASDGVFPPQDVCAYYRKAGFDVFALTDHYTMQGSVKAREFYNNVKLDLKLYLGEETHPLATDPHIVNWGCDKSVNEIIYGQKELYERELREIIEENNLQSFRSPFTIANCIWRFRKIKESGGMAIFAHPYWKLVTDTVEDEVIDYIFRHDLPDAFELMGGNTVEDNNMQLNYYMQYLRDGKDVPIVGNSDSHADNAYFCEEFTIVFSENDEKNSIIDAVKKHRTVVYEQNSADTRPRLYGSNFRYTPFGSFLIREYFPALKKQYEKEGKLMQRLCAGDASAKDELAEQSGTIASMRDMLYGKVRK